jgi:hypothetical protein
VAQFVRDINNLFAVIGSGLRQLECQSDVLHKPKNASSMSVPF